MSNEKLPDILSIWTKNDDDIVMFKNILDTDFVWAYNWVEYHISAWETVPMMRIKAMCLSWTLVAQTINCKPFNHNETELHTDAVTLAKQVLWIKTPNWFIKEGSKRVVRLLSDGSTEIVYIDKNKKIVKTLDWEIEIENESSSDSNTELVPWNSDPTIYDDMSDEELIKFAETKEITFPEEKTTLSKKERNKLIALLSNE